ncbi:hypothetical protein CPB86DRAFT_735786 [Serendipita vermifera]|nr:hypothetical protein CPB86DRAFT_735786 [Serendipita vermifera]
MPPSLSSSGSDSSSDDNEYETTEIVPSNPPARPPQGTRQRRRVKLRASLLSRMGPPSNPQAQASGPLMPGPSASRLASTSQSASSAPSLLDRIRETRHLAPPPNLPGRTNRKRNRRDRSPSGLSEQLQATHVGISKKERDDEIRALLGLEDPTPVENANAEQPSATRLAAEQDSTQGQNQLIQEYTCPICFSPPTNACVTLCGHVMCASCLFSSVRAAKQRFVTHPFESGPNARNERKNARCPVCRAIMKGWDGKGAGVIGLWLNTEDGELLQK